MVNKEFIIGNGAIVKDFLDRNIPQYSNNDVSVSVLIPTSVFENLTNYSVEMAISKKVGGTTTNLPNLICYSAKTIKYEGVDYIKWQCILSISYTDFVGQLYLTPYIIQTEIINEGEEDEETIITKQSTYTTATLNVIKGQQSSYDASLDEPSVATTLNALIEAKNIKKVEDYKNSGKHNAILGCFADYNATYYEGWLLIVKYYHGECALLPYKNSSNQNEFTCIDLDGKVYRCYNYTTGFQNTYSSEQLSYSKANIDSLLEDYCLKTDYYNKTSVDSLLADKVDKTQTINGHALSGNVVVSKSDVGLGNVENNTTINSPTENATTSWVNAGGLWTYLKTNYADKSDYDTTKAKVEELYTSFKGTSDNDNVVNTLYDLIQVFSNFPESDNIASVLSGLDSRLDTLEALDNVVITINGSITLDADNWVSNSGDYSSDYPYKITYQNNSLINAENFEVVFSVDSDTSLLSTTATLDNATGTITFYASGEVAEDITIDKIVAITSLGAISTISTDTITQVQQNKNDITDLRTEIANVKSAYKYAGIYLSATAPTTTGNTLYTFASINIINVGANNIKIGDIIVYSNNGTIDSFYQIESITKENNSIYYDCFKRGDVGGGGSQLYQHNLKLSYAGDFIANAQVINNSSTPLTMDTLKAYLTNNGFTGYSSVLMAIGFGKAGSPQVDYDVYGIFNSQGTIKCKTYMRSGNAWGDALQISAIDSDIVVAL